MLLCYLAVECAFLLSEMWTNVNKLWNFLVTLIEVAKRVAHHWPVLFFFHLNKDKALANEETLWQKTLLLMKFLVLRKLGNIWTKSEQNQKHFLCPAHKICVRNKCCVLRETGKHLWRQLCVRNSVSSFARAFTFSHLLTKWFFLLKKSDYSL